MFNKFFYERIRYMVNLRDNLQLVHYNIKKEQ
ncbi:hypothetical protein MTsPCn9_21750 [Croceitalea sp. MTPC9]|nr:hypothetical protein MTsPCn6_24510 [Croceitalea sp. MTPC6]GMN17239.1 hypothetical protein MTsPCn9_21750 [Croceitalea sp. MTPC9]